MANSDQENNDSQSSPEVEDPITNPGKREPVQRSAESEAVAETVRPSRNNNWILIGIVAVIVVLIGLIMTGGSDQPVEPTATTQGGGQASGSETGAGEGGESSQGQGEGGEGLPATEVSQTPSNSEGAQSEAGLDSIRLDTEIAATTNEELIAEITDMLLLSGLIGPDDVLSISSETETNGNRIIRLEQSYSGIPVFGGVIVAIENGDVVFNISGETGSDIEVDVEPELSFEEALAIANQSLPMTVSTRAGLADAQLFIINVDDIFHLAWLGIVVIDNIEERVFLDAHDGSVLQRLPTNTGEV
jgi:hypothetical protein